jgi:hypothetical protein
MPIIVIPDVHKDFDFVNKILDLHPNEDEYILLGDFFDSFHEPPRVFSFRDSCRALKHLILEHPFKDKFVFLLGNHDLSYIYHNNKSGHSSVTLSREYYCSGVTKSKIGDFRKEFFDKGLRDDFFLQHFKLAHREGDWSFSHAGILIQHIPYGKSLNGFINEICPDAFREFRNFSYPHNYLLSSVGLCRGGNNAFGGLLWCDWNQEFYASPDIGKQICGHTTQVVKPGVDAEGKEYESWCLDSLQNWYGIIDDNGNFQAKKLDQDWNIL